MAERSSAGPGVGGSALASSVMGFSAMKTGRSRPWRPRGPERKLDEAERADGAELVEARAGGPKIAEVIDPGGGVAVPG
eukprot:10551706-Lingulodinium_polyedra.AAC.1